MLEALREYGQIDPRIFENSQHFLKGVQKYGAPDFDGGFCSSTVTLGSNKGDTAGKHLQSYATATADGLLALLASGYAREDQRVRAAFEWLKAHDTLSYPEGIPHDHPVQWHLVMRFYHLASRGGCLSGNGLRGAMAAGNAAHDQPLTK